MDGIRALAAAPETWSKWSGTPTAGKASKAQAGKGPARARVENGH
jgi:hypothetical protein